MTNFMKKSTGTWQDWICLLLGAWLLLSPWILGFTALAPAFWNALLFGAIIVGIAIAAIVEFHDWEDWVDMAIGLWLIVSPWVLGFAAMTAADGLVTGNFVATGLATLLLAAWSLRDHHGGTWFA
ncbi:SPW repeat protein [Defluviimonas sp. WL0024]|uniref:SPW repeat protein n=1 Tax=Albidovulum salinarum TaxID=2984153 RepID=A0ABT2X563_9RHOB|nr:SPW repeat protein [Defluviimonas sp. WL0024]MCU9849073.1 SPW repeat protein [Defluviimonas sp. WL0024]